MKAQPGPMVSGSHFFPKAPLLWVKWMPAWEVMSRKVICADAVEINNDKIHHGDTEARRQHEIGLWTLLCLRDSGVNRFFEASIICLPRGKRHLRPLPSRARLGRARRPSPHERDGR